MGVRLATEVGKFNYFAIMRLKYLFFVFLLFSFLTLYFAKELFIYNGAFFSFFIVSIIGKVVALVIMISEIEM